MCSGIERGIVRERIVVLGAGGHASVVLDALLALERFEIAGLIDSIRPAGQEMLGFQVLGNESVLPALAASHSFDGVVVAIGDNWQRAQQVARIEKLLPSPAFPSVVHPSAVVARSARIGAGTVVFAGVIVNANASVGRHCILNTKSSLDHDCEMGDYASLAPGVTVGGRTRIGEYTAVSLGASVIHNLRIGSHSIIGAGSTVVRDVPNSVVAFGTPARIRRQRAPGERYL